MQKVTSSLALVAYGPPASGKTYILRKVKEFLEAEGFSITGPMEVREVDLAPMRKSKEVIYIRR